jgi:hypothetical protein
VLIRRAKVLHTYHEVQVNVVYTERFERACDTLLDALVPWVVELGCDPDLFARDARVFDTLVGCELEVSRAMVWNSLPHQPPSRCHKQERYRCGGSRLVGQPSQPSGPHQAVTAMFRGRLLGSLRPC